MDEVDFVVGTFSVAGRRRRRVRVGSRRAETAAVLHGHTFTASSSPSNVASVLAAVRIVRAHPELRDDLWRNIRAFRRGLIECGFVIGDTESPIVPILTGDEDRTIALWQALLSQGLYVNVIVPPGCAKDESVLRASCSAAHTAGQISQAIEILARAGAELGITRVTMS
jgi:8-amino-7-oxononanoate synthase